MRHRVAESERQVGYTAEHDALVGHGLTDVDVAPVDVDRHPPEHLHGEALAVTITSAANVSPDSSRIPVVVNESMRSVDHGRLSLADGGEGPRRERSTDAGPTAGRGA